MALNSPLPAGERSTRVVRCAAGEGRLREYERVERPLTRRLRCAPASTSPLRGEVRSRVQVKFITLQDAGMIDTFEVKSFLSEAECADLRAELRRAVGSQ